MPFGCPLAVLLAALVASVPGVQAARLQWEGTDDISLVQRTLQAETEKSALTDDDKPLAGRFYDDAEAPGISLYDDDNAGAGSSHDDGKALPGGISEDGKSRGPMFYDDSEAPGASFYDDGSAPARSFYDDGKAPAPPFPDDGKASAKPTDGNGKGSVPSSVKDEKAPAGKRADWKPKFPVPEYKAGENAEVIVLSGLTIGSWVPCTIKGRSEKTGMYELYLPYAPEGYRNQPNVPGKFLRKDKPDEASAAIAEEAEAFAAAVKQRQQSRKTEGAQAKLGMQSQTVRVAKAEPKDKHLGKWLATHSQETSELAGIMSSLFKPKAPASSPAPAAPPPGPSPQEELTAWLERNATHLGPAALQQLYSKANSLSKELSKLELEQAAQLQATRQQTSLPRQRTQEEELLALANDPVMNGSWTVATTGQVFRIHNASCTLFFEGDIHFKYEALIGSMRQQGEWLVANLTFLLEPSKPGIMLRMRRGEELGTSLLNARAAGEAAWGGDVALRRTNRTSDELPGKCAHEAYGCKCVDGNLKRPDIFVASVGEDAEIFNSENTGWFPCTVIGFNQTTYQYTVFVPQGPPNGRIFSGLPTEQLRRVEASPPPPPPASKKEQAGASPVHAELDDAPQPTTPAARAELEMKAPRTSPREVEQTPVTEKEAPVIGKQNAQNDAPRHLLATGGIIAASLALTWTQTSFPGPW